MAWVRGLLTALAVSLTFGAAHAATVTIEDRGTLYRVGTVTGTFADLEDRLRAQVFYDSFTVAQRFVREVNSQLGFPHVNPFIGDDGPYFVYDILSSGDPRAWTWTDVSTTIGQVTSLDRDEVLTFAVAFAPVPLPAGVLLLMSGGAGLVLLRRKRGVA